VDSAKVPHAFQGGNFIDLSAEIVLLHTNHATGEQAGRKTKMLVKYLEFRIMLVAMQAGSKWEDHKTTARIMVQPLSGNIRFHTANGPFDLCHGQLASHI
jgi:quercetin dioxygenase-like cupin family protein